MKNKKGTHVLVKYLDSKILNCVTTDTLIRRTMSIGETVKAIFTDGKYYKAKVIFLGGKFSICFPYF